MTNSNVLLENIQTKHRSNQEPYYAGQPYSLLQNQDKAIEIDDTGKAVFGNVKTHGHSLVWSCNDLCALDENVIIRLTIIRNRKLGKQKFNSVLHIVVKGNIFEYLN